MNDNLDLLRSHASGMVWPPVPNDRGAMALALQYQLDQSQWWRPEQLRAHQLEQLAQLLRHAQATVPYYQSRLAGVVPELKRELTLETFRALPLMTRGDIQAAGATLLSRAVPRDHGATTRGETSGSTGRPIVYYGTDVTRWFWLAFTLRDHLWHQRDFSGKLAVIRAKVEDGATPGWGPATDLAFETGPCAILEIRTPIETQIKWLERETPDYLLTYPSNLAGLLRPGRVPTARPPRLRGVRTFGEVLDPELRALCRDAWQVPVTDLYSADEVGYIALQCPQGEEHYHVQAENLIVEILDDAGMPCTPGQIGRVLVTTLHNFAMPLVRYAIGDHAEVGEPCPCGRGLPVIRRILGRSRNLLTLPDGRRHWPSFPSGKWSHAAPVRQLQMVQKSRDHILLRVVAEHALSVEENQRLIAALLACLGHPFRMEIEQVAEIARGPTFKYEDFMSEIGV